MVLSSLSALRCSPSTLSHHFIFPSTNIILDNLAQYRALNLWVLFSIKKYRFLYHFDHLCKSWMVFYNWLVQNPKLLAQSGEKKCTKAPTNFAYHTYIQVWFKVIVTPGISILCILKSNWPLLFCLLWGQTFSRLPWAEERNAVSNLFRFCPKLLLLEYRTLAGTLCWEEH